MSPLLIAAALQDETRDLKENLAVDCTIHFKPAVLKRGLLFGREIGLLTAGLGPLRVEKALNQVLPEFKPSAILFVGYAGGASPLASAASLVLAQKVVDAATGEIFAADADLLEEAKEACKTQNLEHCAGGLATVAGVISSPHEKADLGAVHDCLALDMEAAAAARVAKRHAVPFLAVKAVLDPVAMELPDLKDCIDDEGGAKPLMLMGHLVKTPGDMMKLPQLQYCAAQARASINRFVEAFLKNL
ncbi:MAG: hypothetical protein U1D33_03800 [bacterium]|nr:hypothetical protein [bacterium]